LVLAASLSGASAHAQTATSASTTSQIEQRIDSQQPKRPKTLQPNVDVLPKEQITPIKDKFSFVLTAVIIDGATAFTPAELAPLYRKYLATRVTEAEVKKIAEAITETYRGAGYVFSQADIPPQDVLAGVLRLRVTEGYVSRIETGDGWMDKGVIGAYLAPVLAERPVRLATVERAMLLINDLPGVSIADASMTEGADPGQKVLKLKIEEQTVNAELYMDNRGTPSSGRLQTWASASANSLLITGSKLQVGVFTVPDMPQELIYGQVKWSQPVGSWGTTAELTLSGSKSNSGADEEDDDTESDSRRVHLKVRHPLLRTRSDSLWLTGELDYYDLNEDTLGAVSFEDRNRTASAGVEYYRSDILNGDFYATAVYSRGLDVMGASNTGNGELSRSDGKATFDKVEVEVRRLQKLWGGLGLYGQAKGQWANQPLLSAAEFSLGGSQYGRAYDYGEFVGDRGWAGSLELRYTGKQPVSWIESYDVYAFYDGGLVWNDGADRQVLSSAGGGLRSTFAKGVYADLQVAKPLNHEVSTEGDKDLRVLFAVGAGL
jgi:hemolysin activation/secretion protein